MSKLNEEFWSKKYTEGKTGWDLGEVSPPIKAYFDQVENKNASILIPGCGNAYEAEYLHNLGFKNVHVIDLSCHPLNAFMERVKDFPTDHIHEFDFFDHQGEYDFIIEQTLFCAIDPSLRANYAKKANELLKAGGKLVGVMFGRDFESGPPFGGTKEEYLTYFEPYFRNVEMEECYNSVQPRLRSELFVRCTK